MARAGLALGVRDLATIADVSPNTIARFERGDALHARTLAHIQGALEGEGVTFIDDRVISATGGAGVRIGGNGPQSPMGRLFDRMWSLPDLRSEPEAAYLALLDLLAAYLDIVRSEGRQPDVWERLDLNDMLNALNRSDVFGAFAYLRHAITPPDNQSPDYPISNAEMESAQGLNFHYFDRCMASLHHRGFQAQRS